MTDLQALIRKCESLVHTGRIDEAESLMKYIEKAQADEEDDAEDNFDDPSNPSMDDSDDGDEEDDDSVDKALRALRKLGVEGLNWDTPTDQVVGRGNSHANMSHEVDDVHDAYPYKLSDTPAVGGQQTRHKFMDKVDQIQDRESVGRDVAMTRARQRHPELYTSFQRHTAAQSTKDQAATRGFDRAIGKRAPDTYQDLVATEIRKGCSYELAQQRVAQAHGFRAFDHDLRKAESKLADRFQKRVDDLVNEGFSGEEACRIIRKADPLLFKAMQIV
jgi:hypothetical protein